MRLGMVAIVACGCRYGFAELTDGGRGGDGPTTGDGGMQIADGQFPDGAPACLAWQAPVVTTSIPSVQSVAWSGSEYGVMWNEAITSLQFARIASGAAAPSTPITLASVSSNAQATSLSAAASGWYAAWSEDRGVTNTEIMMSPISAAGVASMATRITNASSASEAPQLVNVGTGYSVVWNDARDGTGLQLFLERLDSTFTTTLDDTQLTFGPSSHRVPAAASNGTDFGVMFIEGQTQPTRVYFQHVNTDGTVTAARQELTLTPTSFGPGGLVWNGSSYTVVWGENRDGMGAGLYFAKLDTDGVMIGSPVRLAMESNVNGIGLAWNGSEYLVTVRGGTASWAQRLASDGSAITPLLDIPGYPSTGTWSGSAWALAWATSTQIIVGELCP